MERKAKYTGSTKADPGGFNFLTLMWQDKPGSHPIE